MKVIVGVLDTRGTSQQSPITDSLGGMVKSSEDLANFIGAMMEQDYSSYLTKTWAGQKVAFVDPKSGSSIQLFEKGSKSSVKNK